MQTEGRKLVLRGDISSIKGTAFTTATIEFRFVGDCIAFEVDGRIEPGNRAWIGLGLAIGLQFTEAWLPSQSGALLAHSEVLRWLCLAISLWYLTSFPYFAILIRRQILAAAKDACTELEKHEQANQPATFLADSALTPVALHTTCTRESSIKTEICS